FRRVLFRSGIFSRRSSTRRRNVAPALIGAGDVPHASTRTRLPQLSFRILQPQPAASRDMVKPKRLSQAAIAKATGLSRATVSLVLRGGTGPSEATQAKVLAAAARMGYQRNDLVLSIRSGKSKTVGVLAEPYDSHWRDICYGIHDRLIESNHLPLFLWNNHRLPVYTEDYGCQQIQRLLSRWVDGVILWPFFADLYAKHLHEFQNRNIPVVIIDHANPQVVADSVQSDEAEIAESIVGHLCGLEHREILLVSGPAGVGWADKRSHAIHAELAKVPGAVC